MITSLMPTDRPTDKEDVLHSHNGIPLSHKKGHGATCSNMGATRDYGTKRKRQIPQDITYRWNLKYDPNEPLYETESGT